MKYSDKTRRSAAGASQANVDSVDSTGANLADSTLPTPPRRQPDGAARISTLSYDIRIAVRGLIKTPGFTAVVLFTLAIGIGANAAVFSIIRNVLLNQLPYRAPDQLTRLYGATAKNPAGRGMLSAEEIAAIERQATLVRDVAAFGMQGGYAYTGSQETEMWAGTRVGPSFFRVLGAKPAIGRPLDERDTAGEAGPAVVLGNSLWKRTFGGDPGVVGRRIRLNDSLYTVVGVMGSTFVSPRQGPEVWLPLDLKRYLRGPMAKSRVFAAVARLRDSTNFLALRNELNLIELRYQQDLFGVATRKLINPVPLRESMLSEARPTLLVVWSAALLVLIVACINVAGLFVTRAIMRRREFAVRAALGADRWRLIRQLLIESLLVSLAGAAIGITLAFWGKTALLQIAGSTLPDTGRSPTIDFGVLASCAGVSILCGLAFAIVPAALHTETRLSLALAAFGRGATSGTTRVRTSRLLVAGQTAFAAMLLVCAGLLGRTLAALNRTGVGYRTEESVLTFRVTATLAKYGSATAQERLFSTFAERLRSIGGVRSVGLIETSPWAGWAGMWTFAIDGRTELDSTATVIRAAVSEDFFSTLAIPLRVGRPIQATDRYGSAPVAVVSETFARHYWAAANPLGARVRFRGSVDTTWREVVGVVGDVRETASSDPQAVIYVSSHQAPANGYEFVLATDGDATSVAATAKELLRELDPDLPVVAPRTMRAVFQASIAGRRVPSLLTSAFAALALALAMVGVYGVVSYTVSTRTREFGIRTVLGSSGASIVWLVLRQGVLMAFGGTVVGIIAALAVARFLERLLFGVGYHDPLTFIGAPLVLVAASALACLLPARRALRTDPANVLRDE
ncbi:MAG: ABC transporter permease [Gemmatimonadota bacterium]|nr:ABC transporter permease [Gemmatimonadota bacterium]